MIKKTKILSVFAVAAMAATMLAACGSSDSSNATGSAGGDSKTGGNTNITVISREDGSGTRGAFIELTGVEEKDDAGNKSDKTTVDALIVKSTDVVLTQVSGDPNAIGYVSFGSLNDTVKALKIGDVEPTVDNIKNGSYTIVRPFNIATKADVSEATQDFMNYIMSAEGQAIISDNKYIPVDDAAKAFESTGAEGKVVVAGSSSVSPVMEKLVEGFKAVNDKIEIEVQTSDSSTGAKSAADGTADIGMVSRELKDSETESGIASTVIAKDAIAIIVNKDSSVENLSIDQVKSIYVGDTKTWDDVK